MTSSVEDGSDSQKGSRYSGYSYRIFLLAVMFAVSMVAVGLGVYFSRPPCNKCSTEVIWEQCKALAEEKSECLCGTEAPTTVPPPTPTPKPKLTGLRLNKTLIPVHYNVELKPDIYLPNPSFAIDGHVEIWMRCDDVTDKLVLHMRNLTVAESTIELREDGPDGTKLDYFRWEEDKDRNFFQLYPKRNLNKGNTYYFRAEFRGTLKHEDMSGFYLSNYTQDGQEKHVASTQFQITYARRAFLCFDEPTFKSTFNITIVRKPAYVAVSNMGLLYTKDRGDGFVADVFQQSVAMSVYLVAFAVSEFVQKNKTTDAGTFVRHWSRRDYADQLDFGLSFVGEMIEAFENYTGIPHQLAKTDQIGIPQYASGAMENWGLVVYYELYYLYNPRYSKTTEKALVVIIFAHEIAHQWFGNLVTCDWWDDTFLNEGMASYFETFGSEAVQPAWDMTDELLLLSQMTMTDDSSSDVAAVRQPGVAEHDEIMGVFSMITYFKAAPLMRMIAYFLGHDTFRSAMQQYLRDHAYKTVTYRDFYDALAKQAMLDSKITWDESKTNMSAILSSWFEQPGHPVVTITNRGGGRYRINQKRYLSSQSEGSNDQTLWSVPFAFTLKAELGEKRQRFTWFSEREIELQDQDPDFIIGNYESQGFYRVDYDQGTWDKIIDQLNSNHEMIDKYTRGQLMYDMETFTDKKYGGKTEVDFLKLTEYLKNETEWLSWNIAVNKFKKYEKMFFNTETYDEWHRYFMDRVLTMLYDHVGWVVPDDESSASALVRSTVLETACSGGYTPCITKARELYRKWMENKDDNPIHPDLRLVVYCHGIASGGIEEWNFAYEMYNKTYKEFIGTEKDTLRQALSCTRKQWILKKHLNIALQKDETDLVNEIAGKPLGQSMLWDLLLTKQIKPTESLLQALTGTYSTPADLQKFEVIEKVISDNTTASMFDSVKKNIKENIDWMNENEAPMREWLQAVNAKQSHVISLSQDQSIPNIGSSSPGLLFV